jgi:general secretion pathway protein H
MTLPPGDRRAERGFTLIEMIVVLVILGLVAGLVLVRGPQRSGTVDLRQASSLVAGALRVARSQAIASNRSVPVRFDPAAATLRMGSEAARRLPSGIAMTSAAPVILFRPDGSSTGGVVELAGRTRTTRIAVNWLTGRVETQAAP